MLPLRVLLRNSSSGNCNLSLRRFSLLDSSNVFIQPSVHPRRRNSVRFLNIHRTFSKAAIEKERTRIGDEIGRGYFADISEFKKHGGKISMASKVLLPAAEAMKFPSLEVSYSDGSTVKLPITSNDSDSAVNETDVPKVSLLCLSFRASSQAMIESWNTPFLKAFNSSSDINLYQVSFIDSWLLSLKPVRRILLRMMRKSSTDMGDGPLQRQIVYAFGDHYWFRKELKILNLLTGYIILLDRVGRVRWQGYGMATKDEVTSLLSCSSILLGEG